MNIPDSNLDAIKITRKTGLESFLIENHPIDFNLLSFWQWSGSDLSNNAYRGMLAEFIVARALGTKAETRTEWDAYDLITNDEIKVEVKSSAYLQSWQQNKLSRIEFDICPTNGWEANTNKYSIERKRQADIYVFSVLNHLDKMTLNPLNLDQWEFYVLSTSVLNAKLPNQKKLNLNKLLKLNPIKTEFSQMKEAVEKAFNTLIL